MKTKTLEGFLEVFQENAKKLFFAPGRVNIIGEHIDYNGGLVMPCALNLGTYLAVKMRDDKKINLASMNYEIFAKTDLNGLDFDQKHGWANYPKAVIKIFNQEGHKLTGFDMYFTGDLPRGAGLSSSASLCMAISFAINSMFGFGLGSAELTSICQKAESINGVNCGVMDPFASAACKKDHAILLECTSLKYSQVPLDLGDWKIVIANTNKQRGLNESKYNERRSECELAFNDLKKAVDINALCDLSPDEFMANAEKISCETAKQRAKHAVFENERVKKAAKFAKHKQWSEFSRLMKESHESLRDLYQVSCHELDSLVKHSYDCGEKKLTNLIYGARMTGAGFGGCTVNIVHKEDINCFKQYVSEMYTKDTGMFADFYEAVPDDGAREVEI